MLWFHRFCSLVFLILLTGCQPQSQFPDLSGEYLGQSISGKQPCLFAPGIISSGMSDRDMAITPEGKEIYFCRSVGQFNYATILVTRQIRGRWQAAQVASFARNPAYINFEPCLSPDGQKLYFLSNRPDTAAGETEAGDQDIWVVERQGTGWGDPYNLGPPVNSNDEEYYPSVTQDGTIYFTRQKKGSPIGYIYRSRYVDGQYTQPEKLPENVNCGRSHFNAFIAPDESYIIVPVFGRADSFGGTDYYIVFRNPDDTWSEPVNMGPEINTASNQEWSPYVSPDGKYFFFMSARPLPTEQQPEQLSHEFLEKIHQQPRNGNADIYWVSSALIDSLKTNR